MKETIIYVNRFDQITLHLSKLLISPLMGHTAIIIIEQTKTISTKYNTNKQGFKEIHLTWSPYFLTTINLKSYRLYLSSLLI